MKDKFVEKIVEVLSNAGYKMGDTGIDNQIGIMLPHDLKGRERQLVVVVEKTDLTFPGRGENVEWSLEMVCNLPFKIEEGTFWQTLRAVNVFNKGLPIPGLVVDEERSLIYYRNVFITSNGSISDDSLLAFVNLAQLFIESCSGPLEEVASGKEVEEVLAGTIQGGGL